MNRTKFFFLFGFLTLLFSQPAFSLVLPDLVEQICITNSNKKELPTNCVFRTKEFNYVTISSKRAMNEYLKKLKLDWSLTIITDLQYKDLIRSQNPPTEYFTWSETFERGHFSKCFSTMVFKILEGGIPVATKTAGPAFAFGQLLGGAAGFGLSTMGVITVVTAPVAMTLGSGIGGVVVGGLAGTAGFVVGGTSMAVKFYQEDKGKICGSFHSYTLTPVDSNVTIKQTTNGPSLGN